ncbi:hypothetical protein M408DRAFT_15133 [Serendipita vermifera MAFF 305830]|uniref:Adenylate kinase n=1 Tax=Serendipita vermifera MAFF 305830 TaxID=933852 RepID=A0A0C3B3E0_SERVB|nr:hypothetical protein M408DRAFT_15133 [Serendipita vermifera MAFF 305830]
MSADTRPLRGKNGIYRIVVHGNSGTGKSTMAKQLGDVLRVPAIHLDTLHWRPGWVEAPNDEMIKDLAEKLDQAARDGTGWVVDGNYESCIGRMTDSAATDIIWLDPPFYQYFPRIVIRTFRRLLGIEESCAAGCEESWRECFFSSKSILWWCITHHSISKTRYQERWRVDQASQEGKWQRLGGFDEGAAWLDAVKGHVKSS